MSSHGTLYSHLSNVTNIFTRFAILSHLYDTKLDMNFYENVTLIKVLQTAINVQSLDGEWQFGKLI
jgi:hypothetical protein